MTARTAALLVALGALALADPTPARAASQPVSFAIVAEGKTSAIREPAQVVVRDQAAWVALWRRHTGNAEATPPPVDFARDMVIALFAGEVPATQTLQIRRMALDRLVLVVYYTLGETRPPADGEGLPTIAPFQIVRTARLVAFVRFAQVRVPQPIRSP